MATIDDLRQACAEAAGRTVDALAAMIAADGTAAEATAEARWQEALQASAEAAEALHAAEAQERAAWYAQRDRA